MVKFTELGWGKRRASALLMAFLLAASFLPLISTIGQTEIAAASPDSYPVVAAENGGNNTTESTEHTVNLPSDISVGDLLLVFFVSDAGITITFPEGWTQLFQTTNIYVKVGAWYRIAEGGEGATITVTTSTSEMTAHTSYRITGYSGTPEVGTPATGLDANPDPPSLTPSWGAKDTLWFAVQGNDDKDIVSAYPTDYTDGRNDYANAAGGCGVGSARRELNAESENPLPFTISASEQWVTNTVAIQPSVAAPGKPVLVSPENQHSTSDNTPTFVWENGSDATSHRLVIDNSQGFDDGENIYDNASAWDNSGTEIENELPVDNYWWKVAGVANSTENWSENTWTFEITANVAPTTPTTLVLTPSPCYITDELVGAGSGSTDADGDAITYYYAFYNETDSTMRQDWNTDNSYTLVVALDAHDNIRVFVMAYDGYENSADNLENSVVITDTLPTKPTMIALSPDPIYVGNTLTATASGHSDADDDMMFIYYTFYNENDSITRQGPHVNDEYVVQSVDAHDNMRVFAYIYTLYGESPSPHFDNSILVTNTKPLAENQETDNEVDPTDVDSDTPVLSWDYQDNDTDAQENFQIQVGTVADGNDMWDNNQQNPDNFITYSGAALTEGVTYHWRVRVYDNFVWSDWLTGGTFEIAVNRVPYTPTIDWPPDGYDATVGEVIHFEGTGTDPDGDELTYHWDFGDFTSSDEENPDHVYGSEGDYTVTITVTDPSGETSTTTIVINVTAEWGPGAPGWVPPEEEPPEEPPVVGIPKPALPIMGVWAALLAVCAVYLSSLKDGPLKRRWAHDISKWIIPTFAVLTLLYIRTEGIVITPMMAVVGAWVLIFAVVALHFSSIAPGRRRQEWTKQFLKFVLPTLIILTIAYLRINGVV